ncbi:MAG: 30S ribosomal protein S3 [SAR202 cluster bacterium]|nr:30S ribosomal protein S3 [Chloroflexota bacterium]MQG39547.1 30S ribosomal protein S3 [SAR202 cluster bacterium]
MGNKTHPVGFRLGIVKDWQSKWITSRPGDYKKLVAEDLDMRKAILSTYPDAAISDVFIERGSSEINVTINTARPGIIIGRGGQKIDEMRKILEKIVDQKIKVNVKEIRQPELNSTLVAQSIAEQLVRRVAFRRAIRQATLRTMQAGAQGIKILCSGRLGGAEIARSEKAMEGRVPLHTLRADIDFSVAEADTDFGKIGVKVWIYKGEILPSPTVTKLEEEEIKPIEITVKPEEAPEATMENSTDVTTE